MKEYFMNENIDKIDLKILRHLQADGRLTNADLADMVAVSPATCHRRTQRLFDEGYIDGVHAAINPEKVEHGSMIMVGVVLDQSTQESFAAFEEAIKKFPFVLDCHLVAGDFDYMLKIRLRNMDDYKYMHGNQLITLPGVSQTRTFFVIKEVIDNAPLDF